MYVFSKILFFFSTTLYFRAHIWSSFSLVFGYGLMYVYLLFLCKLFLEFRQGSLVIEYNTSYEWILLQNASVRLDYLSIVHDPSYECNC